VKKLENKKLDLKKSLICTLLIAFAISAMAISTACARETAPPQTPPDNNVVTADDNPVLIAPTADAAIGSNGTDAPLLDRAQDNSTTSPDNNGTLIDALDTQTEDNPPLIAPASQPDNTVTILGIAALATAIAVSAVVAVHYHKKNRA
jgi:hypothetical protein